MKIRDDIIDIFDKHSNFVETANKLLHTDGVIGYDAIEIIDELLAKYTIKPRKKDSKQEYAEYVKLTQSEYTKLCELYSVKHVKLMIEALDNYKGSKPLKRRYESDYRAILSWVADKVLEKHPMDERISNRDFAKAEEAEKEEMLDPEEALKFSRRVLGK